MTRISKEEMDAYYKKAAERKAKRTAKGIELGLRKKKVPKVAPRRAAFNRLERNCKKFVMLRANFRKSGWCEVGLACSGFGAVEVWYHIFPQSLGNGTKYDSRAILGSCNACNEGEYNARKAGDDLYVQCHKKFLGEELYAELYAETGRRQISTVEAISMADGYATLIKNEVWKLPDSAVYCVTEKEKLVS